MEQIGQVVEINGDKARVMVRRHDVCNKCGGCNLFAKPEDAYIDAQNIVNAVVGQTVRVATDTAQVIRASFVVYMVPIIALVVGILIGQLIADATGLFVRMDLLVGVVFMLASYYLVRRYDRGMSIEKMKISVIAIIEEPAPLPEDERC